MRTLSVLTCIDKISVIFYLRSLTDDQILATLRDLQGDDSGENKTKSDNFIFYLSIYLHGEFKASS